MPQAVLTAKRRVTVREASVPEPKTGEVLVEVRAVGLCGSDLHYWRIGRIGDQVIRFPQPMGHEPAGTIAALGRGVRGLREGQAVAVEPGIACGRCRLCRIGRINLCENVRFLGAPGMPAALQRYLAMPAENVVKMPRSVDFALGSAGEPLGVAMQAFDLVALRKGERVAVIGGGPIGLCVVALAKALGAKTVALAEPRAKRRRVAAALGAGKTVEGDGDAFLRAVNSATRGEGADVVVECSGAPTSLDAAVRAAGRGGRVAIVGIPEVDVLRVDPHVWRRKELSIVNVRRSNRTLPRCLRLMREGGLGLRKAGFFEPVVGLTGAQEALARLDDEGAGAVKIVIDPALG